MFIYLLFFIFINRSQAESFEKKDYNVILIVVDALRADHLSCYGYSKQTSPNIDHLATKGVLFLQAFSQATWSLPSFASIFTSRYVPQHKVFNIKTKLDNAEITLAEILKIFGYKTVAFTSGVLLNKQFNLCQGFDVYEDIPFEKSTREAMKRPIREMMPDILTRLRNNRDKKFFLFLHVMEAHPPLHLPVDGDDNMFDPEYQGIIDDLSLNFSLKRKAYGNLIFQKNGEIIQLGQNDINHIISHYDAAINYTDSYIGKLLDELKKIELINNSIIILTADHGLDLFDHNTLFNYPPQMPYDEIIHVPLIIVHPDIRRRVKVTSESVQLIDILPTILEFLHIPPKEDAEGKSLVSLIKKERGPSLDRFVYSTGSRERNEDIWKCTYAIRTPKWKLLMRSFARQYSTFELYNIKEDPKELNNQIYRETAMRNQLIIKLRNWLSSHQENNEDNDQSQ